MKAATLLRSARTIRLGRPSLASLGFLAVAIIALGWITWRGSIDPWPARTTLGTSPNAWPLDFSPDGKTFLTADLAPGKAMVTSWDVATGVGRELWAMKVGGHVPTVPFSPDGRSFATTVVTHPSPARVEILDATTGAPQVSFATDYQFVYRLAWSPDGSSLVGYLGDNARLKEIATWDVATGEKTSSRTVSPPMRANSMGISPDGRLLALCPRNGAGLDLWDLEAGRSLGTLTNPATIEPASPGWVGFSADGKTLAFGRDGGSVELWDIPGRKLRKSIRAHAPGHSSALIRFSPDGRTFVSAAWERPDRSLIGRLWRDLGGRNREVQSEAVVVDVATGRVLARSPTSMQPIYSPDGRTLATREREGGIKLRDVPPSPR